jgi:DHA2 family multidrug resistance protein
MSANGAGETVAHAQWHPQVNPWMVAWVTTLASFMEVLDTTIVNVAVPHIAGNLGADVNDSTWVLTSYLVSNAIIMPVTAWCASLFGRRNYYMVCVAVFTVSSFLCGFAPSLSWLVFFRLLQGVGGGGLQPLTQAILVDTFPPRQRGMSMAIFGMTVVIAPIIGPTLGGWITDNYSWRWIFFINIPVGLFSLIMTPRVVQDPPYLFRRHGKEKFNIDYVGLGLLSLGLGCLQMMLDVGERHDWFDSRYITTLGVLAAVGLVSAVIWEWNHKDPVLDFRLLRERNLAMSCLTMLLFGASLYGSTIMLTLFMQLLLGYTSLRSGLALSPGAIITLCMLPLVGFLTTKVDIRKLIMFGIGMVAFSLFSMGGLNLGADFPTMAKVRILQGLGMAFVFVPVNTIAYSYVPGAARNAASSLLNVGRNIGGSVGIAFASAFATRWAQVHQTYLVAHLTPYDPGYMASLQDFVRLYYAGSSDMPTSLLQAQSAVLGVVRLQSTAMAFVEMFRVLAFVTVIIIPLAFFMKRPPKHHGAN